MSDKIQTIAGTIKSQNSANVETKAKETQHDNEAKRKIAKQMLHQGFSLPEIAKSTGLTVGEIVLI
jgi:SOS response regulatory protein OraA/RecX